MLETISTGRAASCARNSFTTEWQQWVMLEKYSAWHNVPIATKQNGFAGLDTELLLNTPTIRECLMEGRTSELTKYIAEGHEYYGTRTFNQSLKRLVEVGAISYDDALASSDDPDELGLELRGITKGNRAAELARY